MRYFCYTMKADKTEQFFARLAAKTPHPEGELKYTNTYTLLVAVVLSAQATDIGVNKATARLFERVSTPQDMLDLGLAALKSHIKTIGLYNAKAENVMALSRLLIERHGGEVPQTMAELVALPGVGRKTANVVLNMAFGQPTLAVDTHVFRVSNRTGLARGKTVDEIERKLLKKIPPQYLHHAHHWLILHGRYTCKARNPDCASCCVRDLCAYKAKNI